MRSDNTDSKADDNSAGEVLQGTGCNDSKYPEHFKSPHVPVLEHRIVIGESRARDR